MNAVIVIKMYDSNTVR